MNRVVPLRPRLRPLGMILSAAAAALVLVLGVQMVAQNQRIDRMQIALEARGIVSAALAAQGDPDSRKADLRTADGRLLARATVLPDGTGYLWSEGLPRLDQARTYQLWAVIGTERVSVGILGTSPSVVPFKVAGELVGLAITDEVAGGVVATKNQPTAVGLMTA